VQKIRRERQKELKIARGVFDRRTLLVLYELLNKNILKEVIGIIKEGKESVILSGITPENKYAAIKVYRIEACNFKTIWKYLIGDPRFKNIKKDRRFIVKLWCQREFKNLKIAYEGNVRCPKPLAFKENILVMEFIGEDGLPAPRLIDTVIENPGNVYKDVLEEIEKLIKCGLVHGDLSAYNILFLQKPYLIDLSHGTTVDNVTAPGLLERDIKNVNSFFSKFKIDIKDSGMIYEELKRLIEKGK
jgi:RIO kinase 1